jgi:hypothetical protein
MKLPASYKSVTLCRSYYEGPYPPLGFCPIVEHQLGNGDVFGLYWPVGREDHDPIVAETYHDDQSIQPQFSSLERFLTAGTKQGNDFDDNGHVAPPTFEEDPRSPVACLRAARNHLQGQNVEAAIKCLETAVSVLPEYTDAQALLCSQYRRVGKSDAAIRSAIQAVISPPCFGDRPLQLLQWLSRQSSCPTECESDPIWINRGRLTLKFGGTKENEQCNLLREAIDHYLDSANFIAGMTLMQTYAELMYSETKSFQERNGFDVETFIFWQRDVAATRYGKSRTLVLPK